MRAQLLKNMLIDGETVPAGTILDVSGWRNVKSLESMRFITFVTEAEETPKKEVRAKVAK
jgi:hypothetical protein